MRLEWIEDILAVIDTGSFRAAAELRFLTPSAFTRRIHSIEETLGCTLFDRTRKPLVLLPHARKLEIEMRDAVQQLRQLRLGLSDVGDVRRSRLSLGCQHALTATVAPKLVQAMRRNADMNVRVQSGSRSECELLLLRREIDFAVVYETLSDPLRASGQYIEKIAIGRDRLVPLGNLREHVWLRQEFQAGRLPMILYPASIYLGEVLRAQILPRIDPGFERYCSAETGLTLAIVEFIRQGLGIGWLPYSVAASALERGEVELLEEQLPTCNLDISFWRPRSDLPGWTDPLWHHLAASVGALDIKGVVPGPIQDAR